MGRTVKIISPGSINFKRPPRFEKVRCRVEYKVTLFEGNAALSAVGCNQGLYLWDQGLYNPIIIFM